MADNNRPIQAPLHQAMQIGFHTPPPTAEPSLWQQLMGYFSNPGAGSAQAEQLPAPTPKPEQVNPFVNFANKATGRNFK